MNDETRCVVRVWEGFHDHRCFRKTWKDGYCKQHHPDTVAERRRKSMEKWEEKRKQEPWYRLQRANERIKELEELVATLRSEKDEC